MATSSTTTVTAPANTELNQNLSKSPFSLSSSSSLPSKKSTPVPFFESASSSSLLSRCIRFLPQSDRVRAARASHHLFEVCCSEESWACDGDGALSSLESNILDQDDFMDSFSFNGPTMSCSPLQLINAAEKPLFHNARCIHLINDDSISGHLLRHLLKWPHLEHLCISESNQLVTYQGNELLPLPNTLRSLTFVHFMFEDTSSESDSEFSKFLSILPDSLETLHIVVERPVSRIKSLGLGLNPGGRRFFRAISRRENASSDRVSSLELDLGIVLKRKPNLKRLAILDPTSQLRQTPSVPAILDFFNNSELHNLNLRIFTNTFIPQDLGAIDTPSDSLRPPFLVALVHLRIPHCGVFGSCSSKMDIASYFPNLSSLRVDLFGRSVNAAANLPQAIGARITTLTIDQWASHSNSLDGDPFGIHGLTNLTSLSLIHPCPRPMHSFLSLSTLTHISMEKVNREKGYAREAFFDFAKMLNLRSVEMNASRWKQCMLTDPSSQPLQWNQIENTIKTALSRKSGAPNSETASIPNLVSIFPALTELTVREATCYDSPGSIPETCYEVRRVLQKIPHLKSIKWCKEPILHPRAVAAHYFIKAIHDRDVRKLEYQMSNAPEKQQIDNWEELVSTSSSSSSSTIARHFNMFNLSLAFQSLTPVEVARASTVSKHWRSAALSPLVLRHHIRVEMDQLGGAKVHGPQIRISALWPLIQACKSAVFRNLRVLTLGLYQGNKLPRESAFANKYLRLFTQITAFTSLHTLALNWQPPDNVDDEEQDSEPEPCPSSADIESIKMVMKSSALKHLKVFRIQAPRALIWTMVQFLHVLKGLEVVELRYSKDNEKNPDDNLETWKFAFPLLLIRSLKQLYVAAYGTNTNGTLLHQLRNFCHFAKDQFDEVMWRIPIFESTLAKIAAAPNSENNPVHYPHLKSIHITKLHGSLSVLSRASATMPHLTDVSISSVFGHNKDAVYDADNQPLAAEFASRLRSLKFRIDGKEGKLILSIVEQLASSNLSSLECLHIFRKFSASETGTEIESQVNELLLRLVLRCPTLTELNCPSFTLGGAKSWERILPQLRIVYSHPLILRQLELCQQLRVYHSTTKPTQNVQKKLLALPYFQSLTFGGLHEDHTTMSRAQVARWYSEFQLSSKSSNKTAKLAEELMNFSAEDYQSVAAIWQRVNEEAKVTPLLWPRRGNADFIFISDDDDDDDEEKDDDEAYSEAIDETGNMKARKKRSTAEDNADIDDDADTDDDDLAAIISSFATS